jgi:hypothetical protein
MSMFELVTLRSADCHGRYNLDITSRIAMTLPQACRPVF